MSRIEDEAVAHPDGSARTGVRPPAAGGSLRERLRSLPVFAGSLPEFDPVGLPADPFELFSTWLIDAIDAGVPEPHAMTIATADAAGSPSTRIVILKDVRDGGWEFATDARSRKATDVAVNPRAAAGFYWQLQGRQVRLTGRVVERPAQVRDADFLARSPASRAAAFAVRPGEPLGSTAELESALAGALELVRREPELVLPEWMLLALVPQRIEFWQGDPRRAHVRVVYRRDAAGWRHELVWP